MIRVFFVLIQDCPDIFLSFKVCQFILVSLAVLDGREFDVLAKVLVDSGVNALVVPNVDLHKVVGPCNNLDGEIKCN